jgi:hypothetical protein
VVRATSGKRDRLVLLDFDPDVVGIASQPFWLFWTTVDGEPRSHAPDYFARLADGSSLVLDVRAADPPAGRAADITDVAGPAR